MNTSGSDLSSTDWQRDILHALDALTEGIAIFDDAYELILCNDRFRKAYQPIETMLTPGLSWRIFLQEVQRRGVGSGLEDINTHLVAGVEASLDLEAERPGNCWARLSVLPVPEGGFVLTQTDITEKRVAALMRAEADDLMRQMLDASAAIIFMSRIGDGEIIYRSPAANALFGPIHSTTSIYKSVVDRSDFLAALLPTGKLDDYEITLVNGNRASFPARVTARIIEYKGEQVVVASGYDMTQLYAQRDEILRMREIAMQTEKLSALGGLLAGVAHELNNPLSVVVGHALMLREETDDPDIKRRLEKIGLSAERCAKIVKTFLAMARHKPATLANVDMNVIVETAIDVVESSFGETSFKLQPRLAGKGSYVLADEDQLTQVLINLLTNATHAVKELGETGAIIISTRIDAVRNEVVVQVEDNGPGVPEELRRRIFEPFFTTKTVGEGTGLGLALCHRMVSAHSGRMEVVESELGGACFIIALPQASAPKPVELLVDESAVPGALKALVVEDERDVAETLDAMLKSFDIEAIVVHSGEAGLAAIESGVQFDIILSDLKMPGLSGRDMAREIERRWPKLAARVAFVTGETMGEDARALVAEGRLLLEKPIAPDDLLTFVRSVANR